MDLHEATYRDIAALMHATVGLSFNDSKRALVASRLAPRIQRLGLDDYDDYVRLLNQPEQADEFQVAVDLLTTNETYFFREPRHFEIFEQAVGSGPAQPVSVWSAASSYGDEAYSLAMVLADLQLRGRVSEGWSVLGTDVSDRVLRGASQGVYPLDRVRHVSPQRLRRYMLRGEGDDEGLVMVGDLLREHVRFGQLNLCEPIDVPGPFDAIFLRNVLIYFDHETKVAVVNEVLKLLKPGGLFFIGMAEGRISTRCPLQPVAPGAFRKLG